MVREGGRDEKEAQRKAALAWKMLEGKDRAKQRSEQKKECDLMLAACFSKH